MLPVIPKSQHEEKEDNGEYYRTKIDQDTYLRTVGLPAKVDMDQVKTALRDGVLELTVPKLEHSQRRNIKVE